MENKKSFLNLNVVDIIPKLSVRIPTVGEILEDEQNYYGLTSSLTVSPFQYMVQLDDMGIDYTQLSDYDLFLMIFPAQAHLDLSMIFGDLDTSDFCACMNREGEKVLYSPKNDIIIDELM